MDARGLSCPLPILRTRKAIQALEAGQVLEVIASDPGAAKDMDSFCRQTGHELMENSSDHEQYTFLICRS